MTSASPEGQEMPAKDEDKISLLKRKAVSTVDNVVCASSPTKIVKIHINSQTGIVESVESHSYNSVNPSSSGARLILPSLCHPHIHLDKPYLLSHPATSHLAPESGDFKEALEMTSKAKGLYTAESLLERGNWLIADSLRAGVTHMRAFVEVDATVKHLCLRAGLKLKEMWKGRCEIQLCVFAQDPVFTGEHADENRKLVEEASAFDGVDAVGSTPYVEENDHKSKQNIDWITKIALDRHKHLDFHLDYFLDPTREPMVWYVIENLKKTEWKSRNTTKTVCLGHCTRLTLFDMAEWKSLAKSIQEAELPIYFVGLPTSDVFMMDRVEAGNETRDRKRATLQIPWLIDKLHLNATLSINNVGNAFTPQGSADPLATASMGVGLYQLGTANHAHTLYECISTRAKQAIGLDGSSSLDIVAGVPADFVIFGEDPPRSVFYRQRRTTQEIVYDPPYERTVVLHGQEVHSRQA